MRCAKPASRGELGQLNNQRVATIEPTKESLGVNGPFRVAAGAMESNQRGGPGDVLAARIAEAVTESDRINGAVSAIAAASVLVQRLGTRQRRVRHESVTSPGGERNHIGLTILADRCKPRRNFRAIKNA